MYLIFQFICKGKESRRAKFESTIFHVYLKTFMSCLCDTIIYRFCLAPYDTKLSWTCFYEKCLLFTSRTFLPDMVPRMTAVVISYLLASHDKTD